LLKSDRGETLSLAISDILCNIIFISLSLVEGVTSRRVTPVCIAPNTPSHGRIQKMWTRRLEDTSRDQIKILNLTKCDVS